MLEYGGLDVYVNIDEAGQFIKTIGTCVDGGGQTNTADYYQTGSEGVQ